MNIELKYNEDIKRAVCTIIYNQDICFTGIADCAPEDENIVSETIGKNIAEMRALIKYLRFARDYEIKPKLDASLQLYYAINRSKQYNKKSYEAKMLYRQIQNYQEDMNAIKQEIQNVQMQLKSYIDGIDKFKDKIN